ncbi:MAG: RHS repeat-associated core domain-containing protein, partial [Sphaerochaetaceae bacterium]|nr:RHS repeat-associated core domain-containing protein [Sphaerochaetaceae bacterium]
MKYSNRNNHFGYSTLAEVNPYRYRCYRYDNEAGLYYLNSRYYNSNVGRFINSDGLLGKVGNIKSSNMFMYANNNPIMFVDTTGEWALLAFLAASNPITLIVVAVVAVVVLAVIVESGVADAVIDSIDEVSNTIDDKVQEIKNAGTTAAFVAASYIAS